MKAVKTFLNKGILKIGTPLLLLSGLFIFSFWLGLSQNETKEVSYNEWILENNFDSQKSNSTKIISSYFVNPNQSFSFIEFEFKHLISQYNDLQLIHYQCIKKLEFNSLNRNHFLKSILLIYNSESSQYPISSFLS